ncbi:MAG: hypothetical protein ABSD57_12725 [Verrucomicrobiota bacterium]
MLLLNRWMMWGSKDEAKEWVGRTVKDQTSALNFLVSLLSKVKISEGPRKTEVRHVLYLKLVEQFIGVDVLEKLLSEVTETSLNEIQASALRQFRTNLDRKRRGQPYDQPGF